MYQVVGTVATADQFCGEIDRTRPHDIEPELHGVCDSELEELHKEVLGGPFTTEEEAWHHVSFWIGDFEPMSELRDWQAIEYDDDLEAVKFVRVQRI